MSTYPRQANGRRARKKRIQTWRRIVSILCVITVFCTTYALVLPAITLEKTPCCGMEEHTHTEACYEQQERLTCTLAETEGHVHTDECYETTERLICPLEEDEDHVHTEECYETEQVLVCEQEECEPHVHTDECYETEQVLVCEIPEHTHTDGCFQSKADTTADVEGEGDWAQMIAGLNLTGNRRQDVLTVAKSQVGYRQSDRNFLEDADGARHGYTRYGAWYGMPYEPWCAMFVSFCLHYAGVPESEIPHSAACDRWAAMLDERGQYIAPKGPDGFYEPVPGDIVFLRIAEDTLTPDHIGIVESYDAQTKTLGTIEGNYSASVSRVSYELSDPRIDGYCAIPASGDETDTERSGKDEQKPAGLEESVLRSTTVRLMGAPPLRASPRIGGNVNDLITAANITVDGRQITGSDWGTLVMGKTYRLALTFRENQSHQFADDDGWMEYDLPPELQVMNVSGKFDQNLGYFGTLKNNDYEIRNGKLRFRWNTSDAEKIEVLQAADSATVVFNMDFSLNSNVNNLHFGAGLDKTVNLENPHDAGVQKTGRYEPDENKIYYQVEITSSGVSQDVHVADTMAGSALRMDTNSITVVNQNGARVTPSNLSTTDRGFSMDLPDMNDGGRYTVRYTASVDFDQLGHSGQTTFSEAGNSVRVTTREDDNPGNNTSNSYLYNIQPSDLTKRAGTPGPVYTEDGQKYRDITWTIHADHTKLSGSGTITDSIDANSRSRMDFTGTGIRVRVNGHQNRHVSWGSNGLTLAADGKSWSYTPPASDGNAEYEITYTTRVKVEENTVEVTNTVSDAHNRTVEGQFVPGDGSGGGEDPEEQIDVFKTATTVTDEYVIWTIRVPVPAEGFDDLTLTEQLPNLGHDNMTDPIDRTYGTNGFIVDGLNNPEDWTVTESNAGYWSGNEFINTDPYHGITTETITFYRNKSHHQTGLRGTGENRELVIKVKTKNNPDWMDYGQESGNEYAKTHQNKVSVSAEGKSGNTTASATPLKAKITKSTQTEPLLDPLPVKLKDGGEYMAYPFQITIEGVQKEPVEIFDTFDTSMFDILEMEDLAEDENLYNLPMYNTPALTPQRITPSEGPWGGMPSDVFAQVMKGEEGALFTMTDLPKQVDPRTGEQTVYYGFYRMTCYLVLKDEEALKQQAMFNGGSTTFQNTASFKDSTDTAEVEYNYKVISKEAENGVDENGEETNRIQHFTININPDKLQLNEGNPMEMTDSSSPSLSIDYDSITVTTDPESRHDEVTYDFFDRTGVFQIPDETAVIIEYDAKVIGDGLVQFRNDVVLDGRFSDYADDTMEMSSGGGGSAEIVAIYLMKYPEGHMEQGTLAGARFRLLDTDLEPVMLGDEPVIYETNDDGPILVWLRQNLDGMTLHKNTVYYLEEIEPPEGYAREYTPLPFVISDDPDFEPPEGIPRYYIGDTMGVRNRPVTNQTQLTIVKRFAGNETLTDEQKERISFRVTGPDGFERTVSYRDFDSGGAYTFDDLSPGEYTVYETGAAYAAEGTDYHVVTTYAVDEDEEQTITDYSADGAQVTLVEDQTSTVLFTNNYSTHSYDFTKVDSRTDQPLEGAVFGVFRADTGQQLTTYESGPDGRFRVRRSDVGADDSTIYQTGVLYYITEVTPPDGYLLPPEPQKYYFYFGQRPEDAPDDAVDLSTQDGEATVTNSSDTYLVVTKRWINKLGEPTESAPDGVDSLRFRIYRTERIVEHEETAGDWEVTQEPTCTEPGTRVRHCTICGELLETETIPALGHDMGPWEVVKEPTTTETGLKQRVCTRCGYTETEVIPVHTHTPGDWVTVQEPTCTEDGLRERYCTGCGVVVDSEAIPALGHDYHDTVTEPTCTEAGYTTHTCSRCGDTYTDSTVPALGHDYVNGICTRCGERDPNYHPSTYYRVLLSCGLYEPNTELYDGQVEEGATVVIAVTTPQTPEARTYPLNGEASYYYQSQEISPSAIDGNTRIYEITVTRDTGIGVLAKYHDESRVSIAYNIRPPGIRGDRIRSIPPARKAAIQPAALEITMKDDGIASRGSDVAERSISYPVDMTPEALQDFLTESGAEPYGDEFTVTRAEGWTKTISDLPKRQGYIEYTYYVVELDSAGDGYNLVGYDGEGTDQVTAINQTKPTSFVLPVTGGIGTSRYTLAGLALLLAACVLAYTKLRRRKPRSGEGGPAG